MLNVLAEGGVDPLVGGSGWLGAGMLGLVIYWLLYKHIPSLMNSHLDQVKQLSADFKNSLDQIVACETETKKLANAWTVEVDRLVSAVTTTKRSETDRIVQAVREGKEVRPETNIKSFKPQ